LEYKYNTAADTTRYGGFDFSGKYNPDILGSITDQDYTSAESQWQGDYDAKMGQFDLMSDDQFTRFYKPEFSNTGDGYQMRSRGLTEAQQGIQDQYQNRVLQSAYKQAAGRYEGDTSFFDTLGQQDYTDYYKQQQPTNQEYDLDVIMNNPDLSDTMKAYYRKQAQMQGQDIPEQYQPEPTPEQPKAYDREDPSTWPENQAAAAPSTAPQQPTAATYAQDMVGDDPTIESTQGKIESPWSTDFEKQFLDQISGIGQNIQSYLGTQQPTQPQFSLQQYSSGQRNSGLNTGTTPTMFTPQAQQGITPAQSSTGKAGQSNKQSLWR